MSVRPRAPLPPPGAPVAADARAARRGARTLPSANGEPVPRLPHEHDESSDSQQGTDAEGVMQQAHADVQRGLVDTDRAPVMDRVYEQQVRPPGDATRHRAAPSRPGAPASPPNESPRRRRT